GAHATHGAVGATCDVLVPPQPAKTRIFREHWRLHIAGTDTVNADVLPAVIDGHCLGQENDTAFGRAVGHRFVSANQSPAGTVVNDDAATLRNHERQGEFRHQEGTFQIDVDLQIPFFFRAVDRVMCIENTGVVNENIQATEVTDGLVDCVLALRADANVSWHEDAIASAASNCADYLTSPLLIAPGDGNSGPFTREKKGGGFTDAGGGTGNQSDFIFEAHSVFANLKIQGTINLDGTGQSPTIHDQGSSCHKRRCITREIKGSLRDLFGHSYPAQRPACRCGEKFIRLLTKLLGLIPQHSRIRVARTYTIDANLLGTVIHRHRLSQQDNSTFGGTVRRCLGASGQTPAGSGIDDHAPATLRHRGQDLARHQEDGLYIDAHHTIPILFGSIENRCAPDDAGVVEKNINATESFLRTLRDTAAVSRTGHVGCFEHGASTI